jgi:hypothetical protein
LAVLAFKSEYYKTSSDTFNKLERRSTGHPERFVVREYMVDEKGEKRLFRGTVMTPKSPYLGEIRVDSLPKLTYNVRFSPEMCTVVPRETDTVTFFIGFDFVSPRALDLTIIG